ncbi:MAG: T9SS type A sorting domain-containing protein [Bacteroidota bacterium]|nr:T9SS type A sorting domain-containing protein [Bacteroidota bacterium]
MKKLIFTTLFFIFNFLVSILYAQAIFYVAPTGNDASTGTIDAPWKTISKAATTLTAGQTAYVRAGTYTGSVSIKNSGTAGNLITLMAYPGEKPIIDGQGSANLLMNLNNQSYIKVSGFQLQNAYMGISGAKSNVIIENNYVYNFTNPGISLAFCTNSVVIGNVAEKCCSTSWGECITFSQCEYIDIINNEVKNGVANPNGGEGLDVKSSKHMRVFGNKIHDLQKLGLYLDSYDGLNYDLEVFNNLVYNCADGIVISSEERNAVEKIWIYNNIVYNSGYCGIGVVNWPTHADGTLYPINNITIENNTVSTSNAILIDAKNGTNFFIRNNVVYNYNFINYTNKPVSITLENNISNSGTLSSFGTNSILADPKFVSPTTSDYHLSSTSPAIDKGKSNNVTFDYDFNARPIGSNIDMGAYEYGAGVPVTIPARLKPAFSTSTSYETESASDGVENTSTKVVTLNGTTITSSFTSATSKVIAALRFSSVYIPKGATILNARIKFKSQSTIGDGADPIQIRAENIGNSAILTSTAGSISSRTKTNSFANWLPTSSINGDYFSNSLDFIVNEIVARTDWASGNAMTFIFEVNSTAAAGRSVTFTSYDGNTANAPQLIIEYTTNTISGLESTPNSIDKSVNIYPNPAKNQLLVDMKGNNFEEISIYDMQGKLVLKKPIDKNATTMNLDISSIAKGLLFISLQKGREVANSKVIFE